MYWSIDNVNTCSSWNGGTFRHFYTATKFVVGTLTEGLYKELQYLTSNINITVSLIFPLVVGKLYNCQEPDVLWPLRI